MSESAIQKLDDLLNLQLKFAKISLRAMVVGLLLFFLTGWRVLTLEGRVDTLERWRQEKANLDVKLADVLIDLTRDRGIRADDLIRALKERE